MEKKCLVLQYLSRYSRETCNTLNSLENKEFQFLELVDAIHRELELEKKKKKKVVRFLYKTWWSAMTIKRGNESCSFIIGGYS